MGLGFSNFPKYGRTTLGSKEGEGGKRTQVAKAWPAAKRAGRRLFSAGTNAGRRKTEEISGCFGVRGLAGPRGDLVDSSLISRRLGKVKMAVRGVGRPWGGANEEEISRERK